MKIRVGSLLDLSTIDWYGHRTFMLFCGGCNFRCPFCMNTSLISVDSGVDVDLELIEERILANIDFLDAIGATGGEPALQPEPILKLYSWAKNRGIKTFLNTNGSNPKLLERLLEKNLLDHAAIDLKAPLRSNLYGKVIGITEGVERILKNIMRSLELCRKFGLSIEVRTTVVPTLTNGETYIREIARVVKHYGTYVLQQYFPYEDVLDEKLRRVKPPNRTQLARLARLSLEEGVKKVYIRTRENGMELIKL